MDLDDDAMDVINQEIQESAFDPNKHKPKPEEIIEPEPKPESPKPNPESPE